MRIEVINLENGLLKCDSDKWTL